jgi:hypothetical protein
MRVSARFVNSAYALFLAAAFITGCGEPEPTSITAVDPAPRTATVAAPDTRPGTPPPASPPSAPAATERVLSEIGADEDATRVTTARVSFDAGGQSGIVPREQGEVGGSKLAMQNRAAYGRLYAYFHRMHAAALVEAATTLDHARLLARRDEFESSSAEDARYKQWQNAVAAIFRTHLIGKDYEVFGLAVPPDAPRYDSNRAQWVVPFPLLPSITDILGREYSEAHLADHPEVQQQLRAGLPLMTPNIYTSPLRWEVRPADSAAEKAILIPASGDEARALKERLQSGRAFYYLRFNTEVKATYGRDYAERISYTDAALVLRPVSIAIYTVGPDAVLGAFGRVPEVSELWFLGHAPLGRAVATTSPSSGGM